MTTLTSRRVNCRLSIGVSIFSPLVAKVREMIELLTLSLGTIDKENEDVVDKAHETEHDQHKEVAEDLRWTNGKSPWHVI